MHEKFSVFAKHPDYVEKLPIWQYISDLYQGSTSWLEYSSVGIRLTTKTNQYIPKHPGETYDNWGARISATYYDDVFAKAVNRFVDMLFRQSPDYTGDAEEFGKDFNNIDNAQNSVDLFAVGVALSAMLYGHTFIYVDTPVIDGKYTYADYLAGEFRPYWLQINPIQLINWDTFIHDGQEQFKYAVIEEIFYESSGYEHKLITQVRILKPGIWEIWRKDHDDNEVLFDSGVTTLDFVPLVPIYGSRFTSLTMTRPLFKGLADKNRTLYQLTSDHQRKVSLCCNPTPVLKDQMRLPDEPLQIGPNSFINLRDPNGSFTWQEPLALSLEQSRKALEDLRRSIEFESAQFLTNPADRQSAAATGLMTNPLEASLATFSRFLANGLELAIKYHQAYFNQDSTIKIKFNYDIYPNQAKDSQAAFAVQLLHEKGLISTQQANESLQELGFLKINDDEVNDGR